MTIKAVIRPLEDFIQISLEKTYGEGKVYASQKGTIKFRFPESHHGCNEMEIGQWKMGKNNKVSIVMSLTYEEAYEYLKAGTRPTKDEVIALDPNAFNFGPKDLA